MEGPFSLNDNNRVDTFIRLANNPITFGVRGGIYIRNDTCNTVFEGAGNRPELEISKRTIHEISKRNS